MDDQAFALPTVAADNKRQTKLWDELLVLEPRILAMAAPTVAGIAVKLRVAMWHMNIDNADCANHDGIRTNELAYDEEIIASALADAERLAG